MRATRINNEDPVRSLVDPDAILLLPLGIDAETVIRGITDFETRRWLEQRARQEETKESDEPCHQERGDGGPHKTAASLIDVAVIGSN